jgi:hypothetical protein
MAMRTNLLLESPSDVILMTRLLDDESRMFDLRFKDTGWGTYRYASARTLLADRGQPVALVINVHTTYPSLITEQRLTSEDLVGPMSRRTSFCLLMAVPSLQALLFTRPNLIARAFGDGADDGGHLLELGRLSPQYAYKRLDPGGDEDATFLKLFQALDDDDIAALRQESPVRELIAFVTEVGSPAVAASSVP